MAATGDDPAAAVPELHVNGEVVVDRIAARPGQGGNAGDRPEQELGHVQEVDRRVVKETAQLREIRRPEAAFAAHVAVVLDHVDALRRKMLAAHRFFRRQVYRREAPVVPDEEPPAVHLCRLDHEPGIFDAGGQRFFAEHVEFQVEQFDRHPGVVVVGHADEGQVDVLPRQLADRPQRGRAVEVGALLRLYEVRIDDVVDAGRAALLRDLAVDAAHHARTDDGDRDFLWHFVVPFR